jgi:hypothetical protein
MSNDPEESIFGRFSPEVIEMILTNLGPGSLKNAGSVDKYAKSVYESEAFWLSKYVRDVGNPSDHVGWRQLYFSKFYEYKYTIKLKNTDNIDPKIEQIKYNIKSYFEDESRDGKILFGEYLKLFEEIYGEYVYEFIDDYTIDVLPCKSVIYLTLYSKKNYCQFECSFETIKKILAKLIDDSSIKFNKKGNMAKKDTDVGFRSDKPKKIDYLYN